MNIILIGAPGAGKGTQGTWIQSEYQLNGISVGNLLRAAIKVNSPIGIEAKKTIGQGKLVDDHTICRLVEAEITQADDYLFDGFPRTINQMQWLMRQSLSAIYVIHLVVPDGIIIERMTGRLMHSGSGRVYHEQYHPPKIPGIDDVTGEVLIRREDDQPDVVARRLAIYHQETWPIIEYCQQVAQQPDQLIQGYQEIDGTGEIRDIRAQIQSELAAL